MRLTLLRLTEFDLTRLSSRFSLNPQTQGLLPVSVITSGMIETALIGPEGRDAQFHLVYGYTPQPFEAAARVRAKELLFVEPGALERPLVALVLVGGPGESSLFGFFFNDEGEIERIPEIEVATSGFPRFSERLPDSHFSRNGRNSRVWPVLGRSASERAKELRIGVCGCGRSGSLLGNNLARLGITSVLVDPDVLEAHSLDGDFHPAQVGRLKTEALAEEMRAIWDGIEVVTVPASITSIRALDALKMCHAVFCATDDDGAGMMSGITANLFLQPLIHVGVRIGVSADDPQAFAGADVRLIVPGEHCLRCFGGIAAPEQVAAVLHSHASEIAHRKNRDWRKERLGSLRSLNQLAVGLATGFFVDFLSGRLRHSLWIRVTIDRDGIPEMTRMSVNRDSNCPLCRLRGSGEAGLSAIHELFPEQRL